MDRQDIDALLIGSLYGELTPAEEARLTAHLESHPGDRTALDDLKSARERVRSSRIFDAQVEPPQAISALLLQEAARRAPRKVRQPDEKEGWFARFVRSFVAHPGVAAAAMLVLVVSVAGTIYMKKGGDEFAEKTVSQSPQATMQPPAGTADQGAAPAAGSAAYNVGLAEKEEIARDEGKVEATKASEERVAKAQDDYRAKKAALDSESQRSEKLAKPTAKSKGIVVGGVDRAPKDMPEDGTLAFGDATSEGYKAPTGGGRAGAGLGGTGTSTGAGAGAAHTTAPNAPAGVTTAAPSKKAAPMPSKVAQQASPPPQAPAPQAQPAPAQAQDKFAEAPKADAAEQKVQDPALAWAKGQHSYAINLAQQGKCAEAAKVALAVSTRAPDYYAQYMASDRSLKACKQYIDAEREKDAERNAKTRAQKRVNADEPALQSK